MAHEITQANSQGSSPIQVSRVSQQDQSTVYDATVAWRYEAGLYMVEIASAEFDPVQAHADDAFEALCLVREQLEPAGWRIGVAGAQMDVWPSGMARDQGGGLRAYRMTERGGESLVDTFEPVDPGTVTTVVAQRAAADQIFEALRRRAHYR